jgi:hypothetical protein
VLRIPFLGFESRQEGINELGEVHGSVF